LDSLFTVLVTRLQKYLRRLSVQWLGQTIWGSNTGSGKRFSSYPKISGPALGPILPLIQWARKWEWSLTCIWCWV